MRYEVVFRAEAENDLFALFDFIADQSGAARAQSYVGRLEAACHKLAAFPHRGLARDDLGPGLRTLSFERRAVIVYRVGGAVVSILRVFSAGKDYERELVDI